MPHNYVSFTFLLFDVLLSFWGHVWLHNYCVKHTEFKIQSIAKLIIIEYSGFDCMLGSIYHVSEYFYVSNYCPFFLFFRIPLSIACKVYLVVINLAYPRCHCHLNYLISWDYIILYKMLLFEMFYFLHISQICGILSSYMLEN